MKTNEQITKEIHEIAKGFSEASWCVPYVAILQPRRDFREMPAQQLQSHINRMVDFTSMSVSYHAIDQNPVDVARCWCMDQALKDDAKYALFIDEDTALPSYGAVRLIETSKKFNDEKIIVGVYYVKFGGPMISQLDEKRRWTYIDATPNTGLRRNIPSCGLGCALIPLNVVRKIQAKFPQIPLFCIVPEGCWGDKTVKALGEDTWWFRLVELCGIEVVCDTHVHCLHIDLATGKYSAHPDVNLDDYITNVKLAGPLTLKDRNRVSTEYLARLQQPGYINGLDNPVKKLPVDFTEDTYKKVAQSFHDVKCTQNYYEACRLCERIKKLNPKVILEIGVEKGGTMNLWLQFAPNARYVGVDNAMHFVTDALKERHKGKIELIEADSRNAGTLERVKEALKGRPVDFLFIDGDHQEDTVRSDFATYAPLVRKGGIIAMHDVQCSTNWLHCKGVSKVWDEVKTKTAEVFVNVEAEVYFGIGMIVKE